jgi:hypothetical protein
VIPQALVFVAAVALANRLNRTWGVRPTMVTGLAVLGAATLTMTRITVDMPRDELATVLAVRSTGLGVAFVPILSAATSRLSMNLIPDGIQFRTIIQRILGALAVTGVVSEIQSSTVGEFDIYPSPDQNTQNPQRVKEWVPVKITFTGRCPHAERGRWAGLDGAAVSHVHRGVAPAAGLAGRRGRHAGGGHLHGGHRGCTATR